MCVCLGRVESILLINFFVIGLWLNMPAAAYAAAFHVECEGNFLDASTIHCEPGMAVPKSGDKYHNVLSPG